MILSVFLRKNSFDLTKIQNNFQCGLIDILRLPRVQLVFSMGILGVLKGKPHERLTIGLNSSANVMTRHTFKNYITWDFKIWPKYYQITFWANNIFFTKFTKNGNYFISIFTPVSTTINANISAANWGLGIDFNEKTARSSRDTEVINFADTKE